VPQAVQAAVDRGVRQAIIHELHSELGDVVLRDGGDGAILAKVFDQLGAYLLVARTGGNLAPHLWVVEHPLECLLQGEPALALDRGDVLEGTAATADERDQLGLGDARVVPKGLEDQRLLLLGILLVARARGQHFAATVHLDADHVVPLVRLAGLEGSLEYEGHGFLQAIKNPPRGRVRVVTGAMAICRPSTSFAKSLAAVPAEVVQAAGENCAWVSALDTEALGRPRQGSCGQRGLVNLDDLPAMAACYGRGAFGLLGAEDG